ncbi:MAG TPA: PAS domain S-box protein, partial [Silvibacterium sp.]|nr:PAS domain S-box protein [Silvibacterium sp.]
MELIDCIELPVLAVDRDLTLVSFNPAAATLLSLTPSDYGRLLHSIQMLNEMQNLEVLCEHVIASGSSHRVEVADRMGSWFSLNISCHKTNEKISGAVLTLTNVTAFRESLERAIEEREFTKAVINTVPEALVIVDADLRVQAANQAFYTLFQSSRKVSQGVHFYQLGSGDWDIPRLRALLNESSAANDDPGSDDPSSDDLGSLECDQEFSVLGRRTLLLNARHLIRAKHIGQLTLIVIQDITERNRAMEALRESEQRFRVITNAAPIMVWMAGTDKLCFYFNKGWLDFVGRTLEQEAGNGRAGNVHPDDFDRSLQIYIDSFDARQPFEMEYRLRHHSGQYRWILDHGVPRYAPDGTFEGYVGGCLDIHDQKEAAEKLRIASETLRESEERLRLAQQVGTIGSFEWNLQSNVNRWTPELEAIYGLRPGEFPST